MSDNWYIVDTCGDTQGAMHEKALIKLYLNETIHSKTYIWNGQTVKKWTPIMNVKYIYDKIKKQYIHHHHINIPIQTNKTNLSSSKCETQEIQNKVTMNTNNNSPKISNKQYLNISNDSNDDILTNEYIQKQQDQEDEEYEMNTKKDKILIEEKKDEIERNNIEKKGDYGSTLKFLKQNSDRIDLMKNIRNGINLREKEVSITKQNKTNKAPKRLKDNFKEKNKRNNSEQFVSNSNHQNYIKKEEEYNDNKILNNNYSINKHDANIDNDNVSLSTSIDQDLIIDIKQNGYYNNKKKKKLIPIYRTSKQPIFGNEVAKRASLIRQRFGEVEVVSGDGRKKETLNIKNNDNNDIDKEKTFNLLQRSQTLKSQQIANRIAKLKHKLDELTDNESWIITRIENIFFTANR